MIDLLKIFRCPRCGSLPWRKAHKPTVRLLTDRQYYGVGNLEYTYPCGRIEYGDTLPEFR